MCRKTCPIRKRFPNSLDVLVGTQERPLIRARFAQLPLVFAVFARADGQRAIRAASVCSTRASIRASVFGYAHALPC